MEVMGKEKMRFGVAQDRTRVQMLTSEIWLRGSWERGGGSGELGGGLAVKAEAEVGS